MRVSDDEWRRPGDDVAPHVANEPSKAMDEGDGRLFADWDESSDEDDVQWMLGDALSVKAAEQDEFEKESLGRGVSDDEWRRLGDDMAPHVANDPSKAMDEGDGRLVADLGESSDEDDEQWMLGDALSVKAAEQDNFEKESLGRRPSGTTRKTWRIALVVFLAFCFSAAWGNIKANESSEKAELVSEQGGAGDTQEQLTDLFISGSPSAVPSRSPTFSPSSIPTFDPIDYNLFNDTWAEATVCVMMDPKNNIHYASRFVRNFYRQFGGRVRYVLEPSLLKGREHDKSFIDSGLTLQQHAKPCDPSWPVLLLVDKVQEKTSPKGVDKAKTPFVRFIVGDEVCRCWSCDGEQVTFREFYSTRMSNKFNPGPIPDKLAYIPLGPRYEFKLVTAKERVFSAAKRKYSFNFMGSGTGFDRIQMVRAFSNARQSNPSLIRRSFFKVTKLWNKVPGRMENSMDSKRYRKVLLNSTFTLAPKGHNYETYRLFEAIEAGSIPVVALGERYFRNHHGEKVPCNGALDPYLKSGAPFLFIDTWADFPKVLEGEMANPQGLVKRQMDLLDWREKFFAQAGKTLECRIFQHQKNVLGYSGLDISGCPPVSL